MSQLLEPKHSELQDLAVVRPTLTLPYQDFQLDLREAFSDYLEKTVSSLKKTAKMLTACILALDPYMAEVATNVMKHGLRQRAEAEAHSVISVKLISQSGISHTL